MEELIENILKLVKIPSVSGRGEEIERIVTLVKNDLAPQGATIREFRFAGADPVLLLANCRGDDFD